MPGRTPSADALGRPTWREVAPFVAVGLLGLLILPLTWEAPRPMALVLAGTAVATMVLIALSLNHVRARWLGPLAPMLFFAVIALAREAGTNAVSSALAPLVILPILWVALRGTRVALIVTGVLTALVYWVPAAYVGAPRYPEGDYWRGLIMLLFAFVVAPVVQRLVHRLAAEQSALTRSEARWRTLLDHLPDTVVAVVGRDGRVSEIGGAERLREEYRSIVRPRHEETVGELIARAQSGAGAAAAEIVDEPSGSVLDMEVIPLAGQGAPEEADVLVVARDVTEAHRREQSLRDAKLREERLLADAPQGVAVLDADGVVLRANRSLLDMTGYRIDELVGRPLTRLAADDQLGRHVAEVVENSTGEADCVLIHADGHEVDVHVGSRVLRATEEGSEHALVVLCHLLDVSVRRRYERRLAFLADHDPATGLANRRSFEAALRQHVEHLGDRGALLLVDLDRFKQVNDTLGHAAGDELIVSVAGLLRRGLRSTDVVGRLGGDEFAILLPAADAAEADRVARRLVARVRAHTTRLGGVAADVSASVGAVTMRAARARAEDPMKLADMAMYDAKESGRNRHVLLTERDRWPRPSSLRGAWRERLERAMDTDALELHLQPIVDLRSNEVVAAEALVRMREDGVLVPPGEFIKVAESTGLVPRLDAMVVHLGVALLADLRRDWPGLWLQINLAGPSLGRPEIEDAVVEALQTHAVPGTSLVLEVTETSAVDDLAGAREFARRMQQLGCRLALDDFGAGFGSYYYLKHLIFDYVKVDGEFVAAAATSTVDRTIVRSIVAIARDLGKQTMAEFVHDAHTLRVVREEGADFAQGNFLGEAMPPVEFVRRFGPRRAATTVLPWMPVEQED